MAKSINRLMAELINDDGDVKLENLDEAPRGLDSAAVDDIAQDAAIAVYDSLGLLPISGLSSGDQAYVSSNQRLYISNGSGWYNVALINLTPTMSLDQSGTIILSTEGVATTVTITAQDSDNPDAILSYSVESDGNGIGNYTLSQDSSIFTITPLTEDSGAQAAEFTLTFKTTDNINTATSDLDFSLTFSNIIDSSAETVLLMKADGNSTDNSAITFQNSSDVSTGFTETGDPQATDTTRNIFLFGQRGASGTSYSGIQLAVNSSGYMALLGATDLVSWDVSVTGSTLVTEHEWHHFAVVKNSTTYTLYLDGTSEGTSTAGTLVYASGNPALVIGTVWSSSSSQYDWHGYIKDFRVSDNARYTTAFTPPTEPFESDSNTELLACSLPYFGDASSTDATITMYGNISTRPFGPYDYEPWIADDHGGSVYFDGDGDYITTGTSDYSSLGSGDFTIEAWIYRKGAPGNQYHDIIMSNRATASQGNGNWEIYTGPAENGVFGFQYHDGSGTSISGGTIKNNVWHHVAAVRNSGTINAYIDGKSVANSSNSSTLGLSSGTITIGAFGNGSYEANAYIAHALVVNGTAKYTADFRPPNSPHTHTSETKFLMNNKSDANVYDAAAVNRLTLIGNTQSSTTQRKWTGSSAIVFDGSGDRIDIDTNTIGRLEANEPFTLEGWYRFDDITGQTLFHFTDSKGTLNDVLYVSSGSHVTFYANGGDVTSNSGGGISLNTWHHIAMTRHTDNKIRIFIDGTLKNTSSGTYADLVPRYLEIGRYASTSAQLDGYVQDVRITKGRARYTASFTAPTAEFEL